MNKAVIPVIIILAVGVPTAYGITITLGGDPVIINGILDLMGNRITNVGAPLSPSDAATRAYVDSAPGTDTLALLGCTSGEAVQFIGSVWTCANLTYTDEDAIVAVGPHSPLKGFYKVTSTPSLLPAGQKSGFVNTPQCNTGDFAVDGGALLDIIFTDNLFMEVASSQPSSSSLNYIINVINNHPSLLLEYTPYTICADLT